MSVNKCTYAGGVRSIEKWFCYTNSSCVTNFNYYFIKSYSAHFVCNLLIVADSGPIVFTFLLFVFHFYQVVYVYPSKVRWNILLQCGNFVPDKRDKIVQIG